MTPWIAAAAALAGAAAGFWAGGLTGDAAAARAISATAQAREECAKTAETTEIRHRRALAALVEMRNNAEARRGELDRARQEAERRAANAARRLASERQQAEVALAQALASSDCAVDADAIRLLDDATRAGSSD